MIQNVLRELGGIQGYGVASLCLFFAIFSAMLVWAATRRRDHLEQMARLPLDDNDPVGNPKEPHE